jgi:cyclopropane fatty-acyl-phospholipid synthase-like methyltransferase
MRPITDVAANELNQVYDQLYSDKQYDIGAVGTLYYWAKDNLTEGSVIDLCCGRGIFGNYVVKTRQYLGVDFSKVVIEQNRQKWPDRRYEIADLTHPVSFGRFDNVVLCDAMEHFSVTDLPRVFSNIKACCRLNTKVFMLISTRPSSGHVYKNVRCDLHLTVWPALTWLDMLKDYGFEIVNHKEDATTDSLLVECKPA